MLGIVRVTRYRMNQSSLQQSLRGEASRPAEPAANRERRHLDQAAQFHPFFHPAELLLEYRITLRMRDHRHEPAIDQLLQYPFRVLPYVEIRAFHQ